jgi:hypothetical protein
MMKKSMKKKGKNDQKTTTIKQLGASIASYTMLFLNLN